jgi:Mg-chelatase subunit ChlD/anti-sigma factor RsiW
MNPDLPNTVPPDPEARLTALLLGELTPEQAAAVHAELARDPELARLLARLARTLPLVREAVREPAAAADNPSASPKLSPERREALLAAFKNVRPAAFAPPVRTARPRTRWLAMAAVAVGLLVVSAGLLLPSLSKAKARGQHIVARLQESESQEETRLRRELEATASKAGLLGKEPSQPDEQARGFRRGGVSVESLERHPAPARGGTVGATPTAGGPVVPASPGGPTPAGEARPQMMDIRMMMRYGLVPRGMKVELPEENGRATPAAGQPSRPAEPQQQAAGSAPAGQLGQWFFTATNRAAVTEDRGTALYLKEGEGAFASANGAAVRAFGGGAAGGGFGGMGWGGPGGPAARGESQSIVPPAPADTDTATQVVAPGSASVAIALPAEAPVVAAPIAPAITALTPTALERKDGVPVLGDLPLWGTRFNSTVRSRDLSPGVAGASQDLEPEALAEKPPEPADIPLGDAKSRAKIQETLELHPTATAGRLAAGTAAAEPPAEVVRQRVESLELADAFQPVPETRTQLGRALTESEGQVARRARAAAAEDSFQFNVAADKPAEGDALLQSNALGLEAAGKPAIQAGKKLAEVVAGYEPQQEMLADAAAPPPAAAPPTPQPETATAENAFSTFSLNVADVSFKLAAASLEAGRLPDPAGIRVEEFVNAFDYRDPAPAPGVPVAFHWERARHPFAHNRDLVRFSVQTAAQGREPGRALNLVLVLDSSGSMERADRVAIIREAVRVLAGQLQPADKVSVVTFARQARLWVDGLPGSQAGELPERVGDLKPEGGTNLEDALKLGYETAARHFLPGGVNRVILLTDGAANLGDVVPASLQRMVESNRQRGLALDCFGIGWEGYNDDLLEVLARRGDGRYGFVNSPDEAASGFAAQLAGALRVAAADVKVQVEFNPARVNHWRQIGYAKHQLTKEQFRDNTVDAAEIGAAEAGTALYALEVNPRGQGPLGVFRVRYREPATGHYREHEWTLAYPGSAPALEAASPAMRLAATAALFGEWLAQSPFAGDASPDRLLGLLQGVPEVFAPDSRPTQLEWMLRLAQALGGR